MCLNKLARTSESEQIDWAQSCKICSHHKPVEMSMCFACSLGMGADGMLLDRPGLWGWVSASPPSLLPLPWLPLHSIHNKGIFPGHTSPPPFAPCPHPSTTASYGLPGLGHLARLGVGASSRELRGRPCSGCRPATFSDWLTLHGMGASTQSATGDQRQLVQRCPCRAS